MIFRTASLSESVEKRRWRARTAWVRCRRRLVDSKIGEEHDVEPFGAKERRGFFGV